MLLGQRITMTKYHAKDVYKAYVEFNSTGLSNASAYFNSGYIPTANTAIDFILAPYVTSTPKLTGFQIGCRTGWVVKAFQVGIGNNNNNGAISMHPWPALNSSSDVSYSEDHTIDDFFTEDLKTEYIFSGDGSLTINGNVLHPYSTPYEGITYPMFIGDVNEKGTAKGGTDSQGTMRMYRFAILESGVLMRDFVPTYENGVIEMKDLCGNVANLSLLGKAVATYGEDE